MPTTPPIRSRAYARLCLLLIVLLVALPVRLYLALSAAMLSRDGVTFIWYAQGLAHDPAGEMRKQAQHPLYPALVLGAHGLIERVSGLDDPVRSWTLAGMSVTFAGGITAILAVYWMAVLLFDRRVGLLAAVLAALAAEFCQLSADALSDMPHLSLYLFSLCTAIKGIRAMAATPARKHGGIVWFLVAGLLSGLAFLMRPEGGEAGVVAAVGALAFTRGAPRPRRATAMVVVCLGVALMASPYMLVTGKLVQKKEISRFFSFGRPTVQESGLSASRFQFPASSSQLSALSSQSPARSPRFSALGSQSQTPRPRLASTIAAGGPIDVFRALVLVLDHWSRGLRVTLTLPPIVWWFLRRRLAVERTGGRLAAVAASLHVAVALGLILRFDYWDLFSLRHALILGGLTLPFTAAGIMAVLDLVPAARRRLAGVLLFVGLIGPTVPWMLERRYAHDLYLRRAGEWIRSQMPAGAKIHTTRHPVAFYANGICQWSPQEEEADLDRILIEVRTWRPDWLVFDERRMLRRSPTFFADLESQPLRAGEQLERVHVEEQLAKQARQRALVYRYQPPP